MPSTPISLGAALSSNNSALRQLITLESFSTPQEFMAAAATFHATDAQDMVAVVEQSHSMGVLQNAPALSDLRCEFETRFARLYSSPSPSRRRLMIAFTGAAMRLMMPLPIFIQSIPKDTDLLVLYDPRRNHYRSGIWDGARSLSALPEVTAPILAAYADAVALGTSGGGFPAIRFAKRAGLRRGLSFGGRMPDDTLALLRRTEVPPAFDPLCACDRTTSTEAILVHSDGHADDALAARCAAAAANSHTITLANRNDHGVLWAVQRMGHLPELLELSFSAGVGGLRDSLATWNTADQQSASLPASQG